MANSYFTFKQFTINQDQSAFKVGTDAVLLGAASEVEGASRILDIGTGTGLIAIMLAQRCGAEIVAIEPDNNSFLQAVGNVNNCPWKARIALVNSRLQNYFPDVKFDLIVSNPPYFTDSLRNPDPVKSATRHTDSLSNEELLESVKRLLKDDGKFQVIMPWVEGNLLIAAASGHGLYCNGVLKIRPTPSGELRRLIISFSRKKSISTEKFLTIEHGKRHEFTQDYINLTRDFYLKFP